MATLSAPGDLINLYISNVTYPRLYRANLPDDRLRRPSATDRKWCWRPASEGVKRAEKLIRPGALIRDINNAAFEPLHREGPASASPEARHDAL